MIAAFCTIFVARFPSSVRKNMTNSEGCHFISTLLKLVSSLDVLKFFYHRFFYNPNSSLGTPVMFLSYKPQNGDIQNNVSHGVGKTEVCSSCVEQQLLGLALTISSIQE